MKKLMIALALLATISGAPRKANASDIITPLAVGAYFTTSTVGFMICMEDSRNTTGECIYLALLTTAITLDAYDKEAVQQASDDAAAYIAGVAEPSAVLNQVFANMRAELCEKSDRQYSDEELAYSVMQMAEALIKL